MDRHVSEHPILRKIPGDLIAAGTAATISPIVVLIDSIVMMRAAKGLTLRNCLRNLLSTPSKLVQSTFISLPARLVFLVYLGTYATANLVDTAIEASIFGDRSPLAASVKFGAVTTVSTSLTIYKDARMAQYFGTSRMRKVPMITYSLFALRDAMTIYASFILPGMVASSVHGSQSMQRIVEHVGLATENSIQKTAQFVLPAMAQFFTTPVHLMGLNFFNQQEKSPLSARLRCVARDLSLAVPIRMLRIIPAFGFGGVINTAVRQSFVENHVSI